LDVNKKPSTAFVKKQIEFMCENDLPFSLKSTITPELFKYMPECWMDLYEIRHKNNNNCKYISYCPTIDYYNISSDYVDDLRTALIQMARYERKYIKENQYEPLLTWFKSDGQSTCSAGANIIIVNMDGQIFPCHGSLYATGDNKDDLNWCSIYDDNFINNIMERIDIHKKIMYNVPEECKSTFQTYNIRCNSQAFNMSDRLSYEEKWTDYRIYLPMNIYFDIISKVSLSLSNIIKGENNG
jgi:hypothetical protein